MARHGRAAVIHALERKLEKLIRQRIEALSQVAAAKLGNPSYLSETGEPYITFGVRGYLTADDAADALVSSLTAYAAGATGKCTLYWRTLPEIERHRGEWHGYTRLLITHSAEKVQ